MGETAAYEVWHGYTLVGTLWDVSVDQPWFLCRFVPRAGWDEFGPLFAGEPIRPWMIYLSEGRASFRY